MPLYRPQNDVTYIRATGGLGLQSLAVRTGIAIETSPGDSRTLEAIGVVSENERLRIQSGEQQLHVLAPNTFVTIDHQGVSATGGLVQASVDAVATAQGGLVGLDPVQDDASAAIAAANVQYAFQTLLAQQLALGLQNGTFIATGPLDDPNTQIIPAPPPPDTSVDIGFDQTQAGSSESSWVPPAGTQDAADQAAAQNDAAAAQAALDAVLAALNYSQVALFGP